MAKVKRSIRDEFNDWADALTLPCFVKKSPVAFPIGDDAASAVEARIDNASRNILAPSVEDEKLSLFKIDSAPELWRVLVALHCWQSEDRVRLFEIKEDELAECGLSANLARTPGNCPIPCYWLRQCHFDLALSAVERRRLAEILAKNWRRASPSIKSKHVELDSKAAEEWGCYSANENSARCSECDPNGEGAQVI